MVPKLDPLAGIFRAFLFMQFWDPSCKRFFKLFTGYEITVLAELRGGRIKEYNLAVWIGMLDAFHELVGIEATESVEALVQVDFSLFIKASVLLQELTVKVELGTLANIYSVSVH